jgi:hypothetical protein
MKAKIALFFTDRIRITVFSVLVLIVGLFSPVWSLEVVKEALDVRK